MVVSRLTLAELSADVKHRLDKYSLFSSTQFASLWDTVGGMPLYWAVCDPKQNKKIIAILPGLEFGSSIFKRFQAMADGCYGQIIPIVDNVNIPETAKLILNKISKAGYMKVYLHDYYNQFDDHPNFEASENSTRVIDITADNWMPPDDSLKRAIKKAERETLVVSKFKIDDLHPFLELVAKTVKRQTSGTIRYPSEFYKSLAELASQDERIIWRIVYHDSIPVASHIYLLESEMLIYWAGFFDIEFSHLKANQFMMYQTAKEYALKSARLFNLGSTPASVDSLDDYKKKWGGELKQYNSHISKSWLGRMF